MVQGVDGLVSGLPTAELVDSLIEVSRGSAVQMEAQRDELQARLETLQTYNLRLLSAKLDLGSLQRQDSFQNYSITSSNEGAVTGTALSTVDPNAQTTLSVLQLAQAHQVGTTALNSDIVDQGVGTITLQVGNGQQETLTFDADTSSLTDVVNAINNADIGVNASLINDGDDTNPYRIVMQSAETGADKTITASGTGAFATLFDDTTFTELSEAQDAEITLGTTGNLTIKSQTNTFDNLIPGTSITVSEVASNITVGIDNDTSEVKSSIETFVESLNSAISFLNENTQFNPDTGQAGLLIAESDLRFEMNSLVNDLISPVEGLPTSRNTLGSVGITLNADDGTFSINDGKLSAALASDPEGVMRLFADSGDSSDANVSFLTLGQNTDTSSSFTVNITQAAEQAVLTGNAVAADALTVQAGVNDALQFSVNGEVVTLTLADKGSSYTRVEMAEHIETLLNDAVGSGAEYGVSITADNEFEFRSVGYGSTQEIALQAGGPSTGSSLIGYTVSLGSSGLDVAGIINGVTASGSGQILTGASGSTSDGMRLLVEGDSTLNDVQIDVRKGLAQRLDERLTSFTDTIDGSIPNKEDSLTARVTDLDDRIEAIDERLAIRRQTLLTEFRTMETIISQLNSQQSLLQGQLEAISNLSSSAAGRGNGN